MIEMSYSQIERKEIEFSVLITVYCNDDPKLFAHALKSIYDNSLLPDKVLLVVDGPVPELINDVIIKFEKMHSLFVLRLARNLGLAKALNVGLTELTTEWVVRADADDINLSNRFEEIVKLLKEKQCLDIVGSNILEVECDGSPVAIKEVPEHEEQIRKYAVRRNPFNHMSVAFKRSKALACGSYPDVYLREDYALWARMLQGGAKCYNIQKVLVHATTGKDMYKRRGGLKYALAELSMQKVLIDCDLKNMSQGIFDGLVRAVIYLMPNIFRGLVYENVLRKK